MKKGNDDLILSIHTILKYGIRLTLPDGVILYTNMNNEIIYEKEGVRDIINTEKLKSILNDINFWSMRNGRFVDINYMGTKHLENSIRLLEKNLDIYPGSMAEQATIDEINSLKSVLRDRTINNILEDNDYGLDNIL